MKFIIILLLSLPCFAFAQNPPSLNIINHFNTALDFKIGINPQVLPDFPSTFTLNVNEERASKVLAIGKESYIRVDGKQKSNAFWGVEIVAGRVKFHGYVSKGIAYSWDTHSITFCTPEEYKSHHHC